VAVRETHGSLVGPADLGEDRQELAAGLGPVRCSGEQASQCAAAEVTNGAVHRSPDCAFEGLTGGLPRRVVDVGAGVQDSVRAVEVDACGVSSPDGACGVPLREGFEELAGDVLDG